eukprot:1181147-Prorocentrum_minimum.AAC.1
MRRSGIGERRCQTCRPISVFRVPTVRWDDIGGLEDVKAAILDTVQLPLQHKVGTVMVAVAVTVTVTVTVR